jgi:protein TonB
MEEKFPVRIGECPPSDPRRLYTDAAKRAGIEGEVVLELLIDTLGRVAATRVVKGLGYGLDESAMRAAKEKCRFEPAEINGQRVTAKIRYTFMFVPEE